MKSTLNSIYRDSKEELLSAISNDDKDFISSIFKIGGKIARRIIEVNKEIKNDSNSILSDVEDALSAAEYRDYDYLITKSLRNYDGFYCPQINMFSAKLAKAIIRSVKINEYGKSNSRLKKLHSLLLQLPANKQLLSALKWVSKNINDAKLKLSTSELYGFYKCLAYHQSASNESPAFWGNLLKSDWLAHQCPRNYLMNFANTFINAYLKCMFSGEHENRDDFDVGDLNTQFNSFCQLAIHSDCNLFEYNIELVLIKLVGYFESHNIDFVSCFYDTQVATWHDSVAVIVRDFMDEKGLEIESIASGKPASLDNVSGLLAGLMDNCLQLPSIDLQTKSKTMAEIASDVTKLNKAYLNNIDKKRVAKIGHRASQFTHNGQNEMSTRGEL